MKNKRILHALSQVDADYIGAAAPSKQHMPRWSKALISVACVCLVLLGGWELIDRYEMFRAGCSANPGTIVGDTYYFSFRGDGIYSFTPGEGTRKELSTFWYDGWLVNEYGIYYKQDMSIYVQVHETGKRQKLYTASWLHYTHIGFSLDGDGSIIVTQYNKNRDIEDEVRIDGITGDYIETVTPMASYDDIFSDIVIPYSRANFTVGNRTVIVTYSGTPYQFWLYEDGHNLLPEGFTIDQNPDQYGDRLWFASDVWDEADRTYYVVSPNGNDQLITLPNHSYDTGTNTHLFYTTNWSDEVWCVDVQTGECWELTLSHPSDDLYSMVTDGEWFYTCAPWSDEQTCWKLIYESERPVGLELCNENVAAHHH